MRAPRPLHWLLSIGVVAGLIAGAVLLERHRHKTRAAEVAGFPLGPATPFDPAVVAPTDARGAGQGTAFSIDERGVWLTARHVVEGCSRVAIVTGEGRGVAAKARLDPSSETAVLLTKGGAPALPIAPAFDLREGEIAYHPGFPRGRPGEIASRLLRRETLVLKQRSEPVLAWREVGHSPFLWGSLAGLSGAPVLNPEGEVIAVTVAQAPRRRHIYTTTPGSLAAALKGIGRPMRSASPGVIPPDGYHAIADRMRRALSVAQVVCLG